MQIDTGTSAECKGFMLGMYGKTNAAEISGGSLSCNWIDVGRANQNGGSAHSSYQAVTSPSAVHSKSPHNSALKVTPTIWGLAISTC